MFAASLQGSDEGVSSSEDEEHDLSDTAQDLLQQLDPACNPFSGLTAAYYREERPSSVGRKVLVIVRYGCHRGRRSKPSRREGKPDQRQSKKVGCLYQLTATIFADDPGNVYFVETHPHCYHTPGSKEDVRWLKLHEDVKNRIEEVSHKEMAKTAHFQPPLSSSPPFAPLCAALFNGNGTQRHPEDYREGGFS